MNTEEKKSLIHTEWHLPFSEKISSLVEKFSLTEKVIFYFFVTIFFISGAALLWQVNRNFLTPVPDYGGTLTEGIIGSPRFINPLLAISDADRDLSSLVYSGLMRIHSDGTLVPDLAQSYTVSEDGLVYTFVLKNNITFHDGTKVTADDVIFTIEKAQDPVLKSPRKTNWDGVRIEKIDDRTIQFTLTQQYSPFIQNTTLGILPKHIWNKTTQEEFPFSQFNTKPIGAGPYQIDSVTYSNGGLPTEYNLTAFKKYNLGRPFITHLVYKSYTDELNLINAFKNGDIESMYGISPNQIEKLNTQNSTVHTAPLSRVFGVFFNQNVAPVFANIEVRQALNSAVNREEIIETVLQSYAQPIYGPTPPHDIGSTVTETADAQQKRTDEAEAILTRAGWKKNSSGIYEKKDKKSTVQLSFSISTGDAPELRATAELLQKQWQKMGAQVSVKVFEISDLNQNIIRPRKYDALLFGEIVSRDLDLYPFWHSSERIDPGLNIAVYTNLKADKILENLRKINTESDRQKLYDQLNTELTKDTPAVFIYAPYFIYITPKKIQNVTLGQLNMSSERLSDVYEWYIETNNVWQIFTKKNN